MTDDQAENKSESDVTFEHSRSEAKRAQLGLNILVILSAVAGAAFFAYVLITIRPFGSSERAPVNVPTSSVAERLGVLEGEDIDAGLYVVLRDIDEAPEYRTKLSEKMQADLGIEATGRLYLLVVRNHSEQPVTVAASKLEVQDTEGNNWQIKWLRDVADPEAASAVGRMRLDQSVPDFELPAASERQLYVFAPGESRTPPSAEAFANGELRLNSGVRIPLEHIDVKVAEQ